MKSRFALLALIVAGSLATGCHMCQSGYDYCGPAYEASGYGPCQFGFLDRKGSILAPGHPPQQALQPEQPDPEPTLAPVPVTPTTGEMGAPPTSP